MLRYLSIILSLVWVSCRPVQDHLAVVDQHNLQGIIDSLYRLYPASVGLMAHVESPRNGISWSGAVGLSDKVAVTPLKPEQPALIASSIKTYVASAVLRLQEEGKLDIEDGIGKHLTDHTVALFEDDGYDFDQIKIKHLLSHTSGIGDYINKDYFVRADKEPMHRWTREEQLQLAVAINDPIGTPQELHSYADVNYLLATEIIEQKMNVPFYSAIRSLLRFDELGLDKTWFPTLEDTPSQVAVMAHQYWTQDDFGPYKLDIDWDSYDHDISWDLYGGGGIATNMEQLAKFSYHLFDRKIIKDTSVLKLLTTDVPTSNGIDKIYRLGIADATVRGIQALGHGGFWGTMVFYIPDLDAAISVCVLERYGKMDVIRGAMNAIAQELATLLHPYEEVVSTVAYDLYKATNSRATLVLYPGGGQTARQTKEEFDILTAAAASDVSVMMMNHNQGLWLDESSKQRLTTQLLNDLDSHGLQDSPVYIGGMSMGGNMALILSDHLVKHHPAIDVAGVFAVDSPIDLLTLYRSAMKDLVRTDLEEWRLAEPRWIVSHFEEQLGADDLPSRIAKVSPFVVETGSTKLSALRSTRFRLYTEPDTLWWRQNRDTDFENTNAFVYLHVAEDLGGQGWEQCELITTAGKGYRANGDRHPHSWSIVDVRDLLDWIE